VAGEELSQFGGAQRRGLFDTAARCAAPKGHWAGPGSLRAVAHYFSKVLATAGGINIASSCYGVLPTSEGVVLSVEIHLGIQ